MRQDSENGRQKGGATHASSRSASPCPPLETPKEGAGAPPGGYLDPHIKLKQKTRRTEAVDEAPYRRGHANAAFGTVADIHT